MEDLVKEPDAGAVELERLLLNVGTGDKDSFGELYTRTHAAVYALALSILANAHDAEEAAHDAYLRVWDYAASYKAKGSPMAWLMAVTRNLCLMELRRKKRQKELSEDEWNAIPAEDRGLGAEERALLQWALGSLDPASRQIVLLHAVAGLKHREIAKLLSLPQNTVLSKYSRAISKMRAGLEKGE